MVRLRNRLSLGSVQHLVALSLLGLATSSCSTELHLAGGEAGYGTPVGQGGSPVVPGAGGQNVTPGAGGHAGGVGGQTRDPDDVPGVRVQARTQVPKQLNDDLDRTKSVDADGLRAAYPAPAAETLSYDPTQAMGLELIQKSSLALSTGELAKLKDNGFVISARTRFPSFAYGYKTIYLEDLPVYVSVDSVLEAVHRTFETLLASIEQQTLVPELTTLLEKMHGRLATAGFDASVQRDVNLYLAVARSLLTGKEVATLDPTNAAEVADFVSKARAAEGTASVKLFGITRDEDFSQFKPRSHYVDTVELQAYFRAMMWLGRVDLRFLETQSDGSQLFYRRQFDAAVALHDLVGADRPTWSHIDGVIGAFVGEHDSMTVEGVDGLLGALGKTSLADSRALSDQAIVDEIARGDWGGQRIASRIIIKDTRDGGVLPLDRSFLLFGQRYTVDSNVFVNVTYDRVGLRMMPDPLDVAFGALGNNAALPLLASDLTNPAYTGYASGLAKSRVLVDAHEASYWDGSLYTQWLGALRGLSPSGASAATMPSVAKTDAWQKRILSTQLASWAELRHDTILYVKQSYTTGAVCEYPDAYVDPYPEVYARLGQFASRLSDMGQALPSGQQDLKDKIAAWTTNFVTVASNLQKMADDQRAGTPHSAELMAFINEAVRWDEKAMCGGAVRTNLSGWYLRLFLTNQDGLNSDPTVADVHTQPTDEAGNPVGRILHVGTGDVRSMVVTVETCAGPRAYAGLASSYGQFVTKDFKRLNDEEWTAKLRSESFPDAPWMKSVLTE